MDTLVLSGGGSKGIIQLGILHHAWELNILNNISVYSGTSIGSVIATLMVCGYSPMDIFQEVLADQSLSNQAPNLKKLFGEYGLISLTPFVDKIGIMIKKKLGFIPTMDELHQKTGKTLVINVTNTITCDAEYIRHNTHPSLLITKVLTASCAMPVIFPPVKINDIDYVDGALTDNLPISPVIMRMDASITRSKILAIEVLRKDTAPSDILSYIYKLINIPVNKMQRLVNADVETKGDIRKVTIYWDVTRASTGSNDVLELKLTDDKKMEMFTFGYQKGADAFQMEK